MKNIRTIISLSQPAFYLSDKLSFVALCWTNWLKFPNNYIPAFKIKTEENDGTLKTLQLSTLEYFIK